MKKTIPVFKYIQYALMIVFGILGANTGSATIHKYTVIVNGILGLVVFYLLYRLFFSSSIERFDYSPIDNGTLFEFPKNIIALFLAFFFAAIIYWSSTYIIQAISFLFLRN